MHGVADLKPDAVYGTALLIVAAGLAYLALRGGFWWLLLWPCASFLLLSLAYFRGSVHVFGKGENGERSPLLGALLSAFILFGRLVWELQTRFSRESPWHAVGKCLVVSRRLRPQELPEDVSVVVDLTSEFLDPRCIRSLPGYRCIPILDANALTPDALADHVRRIGVPLDGRLLIHCANGHGRAGLVAAAWLIGQGLAGSPKEALDLLQSVRPRVRLRRCQRESLAVASCLLASSTNREHASERWIGGGVHNRSVASE